MFIHKKALSVLKPVARLGSLLVALVLLSGCMQTYAQAYLDPNDPCIEARRPIATAGDALEQRQQAMAQQYANGMMAGRERPVVVSDGRHIRFDSGALVANTVQHAAYAQQAYVALKQAEGGQNAAAQLASIQGDIAGDASQFRLVGATIRSLRECRRQDVLSTQAAYTSGRLQPADAVATLGRLSVAAVKDDELVGRVFQQYGQRATMFAQAQQAVSPGVDARPQPRSGPRGRPRQAAPAVTTVASLRAEQEQIQASDARDTAALKNAIDAARLGIQQRTERLNGVLLAWFADAGLGG